MHSWLPNSDVSPLPRHIIREETHIHLTGNGVPSWKSQTFLILLCSFRDWDNGALRPYMDHVFPIQALHTASLDSDNASRSSIGPPCVLIESHPTLGTEVTVHGVAAVSWMSEQLHPILGLLRQVGQERVCGKKCRGPKGGC